jgi:hypothetical protein
MYIAATASERIVDTLEFFSHNFPMPQFSSSDRLIMAANDMSNALKHPHPEVPLSHVGDDTIAALTKLAEIFKTKFQQPTWLSPWETTIGHSNITPMQSYTQSLEEKWNTRPS